MVEANAPAHSNEQPAANKGKAPKQKADPAEKIRELG